MKRLARDIREALEREEVFGPAIPPNVPTKLPSDEVVRLTERALRRGGRIGHGPIPTSTASVAATQPRRFHYDPDEVEGESGEGREAPEPPSAGTGEGLAPG